MEKLKLPTQEEVNKRVFVGQKVWVLFNQRRIRQALIRELIYNEKMALLTFDGKTHFRWKTCDLFHTAEELTKDLLDRALPYPKA